MIKEFPKSCDIEAIADFLGIPHATKYKNIKFINEQFSEAEFAELTMAEMLEVIDINVNKTMPEFKYSEEENKRRWIAIGMLLGQINYRLHLTKVDINKNFVNNIINDEN